MSIRVKRGLEANRIGVTPDAGEPLFTTDTKKLYVGDGMTPGGVAVDLGAPPAPVQSVAGKQGVVVLDKTDVGLGNADNTSDLSKPISTATQTALDTKATTTALDAHTTNTSNPHSVTKAQVGLGNVDNTSDVNKPISTATQTALNAKANASDTVNLTGDQTVAGVKTFSSSPVVPTATTNTQAVNKAQMDAADALKVNKAGDTMTGNLVTVNVRPDVTNLRELGTASLNYNRGYFKMATIGGVDYITGTGFPNGVVSAPVGSIYIDTAVTNGASSWIKKSGTGNTGWSVLEGDTGWRQVTSLAPAGNVTSGQFDIRRKGDTVLLRLRNLVMAGANTVMITNFRGDIGTGFEPGENISAISRVNTAGVVNLSFLVQPASTIQGIIRYDSGAAIYAATSWACVTAWPTTLPGIAIT